MSSEIVFEQPTHEAIRICLQVEQLNQLLDKLLTEDAENEQLAMQTFLDLIRLAERPDLKSKLSQTLSQLNAAFQHQLPKAFQAHSSAVLASVQQTSLALHQLHGRFADQLKHNDFLNNLLLQANANGGAYEYASPTYHLWLQLPLKQQADCLREWQKQLKLLKHTAELILELIRNSTPAVDIHAETGFYQQSLAMQRPAHLVRVYLPANTRLFPDISIGRHRLAIHFMHADFEQYQRSKQCKDAVPFQLAICQI